jgi:hypothetical protein
VQSNELTFGYNNTGKVPKHGIRDFKPFKKSPFSKVHLFFIVHKDDIEAAKTIDTYLKKASAGSRVCMIMHEYCFTQKKLQCYFQ